eukprot:645381-Pelagomonas_calceolata.AAC.1
MILLLDPWTQLDHQSLLAAAAREAEARCAAELTTVRDAGVKLFKQVRCKGGCCCFSTPARD